MENNSGKQNEKPNNKPIGKPNLTKENKRELKRTITTVEYNSSNSERKKKLLPLLFK